MDRLSPSTLPRLLERIERVEVTTPRRWGRMTPAQIMGHLAFILDVSLGKQQVPDKSNLLTRTLIYWLFTRVLTRWPHSLKVPANYIPEESAAFEEGRRALIESLQAFVAKLEVDPDERRVSEIFGPLPLREWSRLHAVHLNHHLRQLDV